mgnify:CR=1 FL=1
MQVDILAKSGRVFMLKMEQEDEAQSLEQAFHAEAVQGIASARVSGSDELSFDSQPWTSGEVRRVGSRSERSRFRGALTADYAPRDTLGEQQLLRASAADVTETV